MNASPQETNTVIIGASAAGLAVAACLKRRNVPFILLEASQQVGQRWRDHYDRLHLHTDKFFSKLPYAAFPADDPRYPSRDQVVAYLEGYVRANSLAPRFGQRVLSADLVDGKWATITADAHYRSDNLVVATGCANTPIIPHWDGEADFRGQIIHSAAYHNGEPYRGQRVLVVGFGNSGGEIAIDLHEHGATPALSVRSPINVLARDTFGIPTLALGIALSWLPARLADMLTAPIRRLTVGDTAALGLGKPPYGPVEQIRKTGRIPLLDIGTLRLIRGGQIAVHPGIERFTADGIDFTDGTSCPFDAAILATGYRPHLDSFLKPAAQVTDAHGIPLISGGATALPGLYFCGFYVSPNGMLREIALEAQRISRLIQTGNRVTARS